jgi:hypothetical protein
MKLRSFALLPFACAVLFTGCMSRPFVNSAPHLEKLDGTTKLIVDGSPFICVAGEVHNSSSSDRQWMNTVIPRLASAHFNTVLTVVSWDLIEPEEGRFDFSMIDYQLQLARENHLRLVFLWMGSWKNGLSHYVPEWMKRDQSRFPRVVNAEGNSLEILSPLSTNSRDADARAFAAVMRHIRQVDAQDHTVIAMQVENEAGVLGSSRDFSPAANAAFSRPVPDTLIHYLQGHTGQLRPTLQRLWDAQDHPSHGTWEEVFGKNVPRVDPPVPNSPNRSLRPPDFELTNHTDELFMAWNYARYMGYVAAVGKREYPLPMYINTWIVQPMDRGPGDYPSGGAEPFVHDVWHAAAPAIDILAPDIYTANYAQVLQDFARNGNPAFNPETRADANNCWKAFTELNALCFSPFGIDNINPHGPFAHAYQLIGGLSGAIAQAQGKHDSIQVLRLKEGENPGKVDMGNFAFDFSVDSSLRPRRSGNTANASPAPPADTRTRDDGIGLDFLDAHYVVIIQTGPTEYYLATNGRYPFRVSPLTPNGMIAAPATIDRGSFINGHWVSTHRYNGDDLMGLGYDLSGASALREAGTQIPLGPGSNSLSIEDPAAPIIIRLRVYEYR